MSAARRKKTTVTPRKVEREPSFLGGLPIIVLCGILACAVIAFGRPTLWVTEEQSIAMTQSDEQNGNEPDTDADNGSNATNGTNSPSNETTPAETPSDDQVKDANSFKDVLGEYTAASQSDDTRRITNLELCAQTIDGTIVAPGEVFSFNEVVGNTAEDVRYEYAATVDGDEISEGRGGGICQVSTALYIAALKADLEIVERHPHSIVFDYAPLGLDSTIDYATRDLKIRNTTSYPISLQVQVSGQTVIVKILGKAEGNNNQIEINSKIVTEETHPNESADGEDAVYTVEAYRTYYNNGVKAESVLLSRDTYVVPRTSEAILTEGSVDATK